jgi:membrane fusion protein (multidrug efflux system)
VRVALDQGTLENVYLVPQAAVQRDAKGLFAYVVLPDDKVEQRPLQAQGMEGSNWIVTQGLASGERVIVAGLQRVRPGASVKAVPAGTAAQVEKEAAAAKQTPATPPGAAAAKK